MDQELGSRVLIGVTLRDEREAQKLSVEEVALRLRLSEKQINALEADDFSIFGSAIFVRGFIKSYARFLTIDPQPLLDVHLGMYPQEQSQSITYKNVDVDKLVDGGVSKLTALIFGVLLIAALFVWVAYKIWAYQSNTNTNTPDRPLPTVSMEQNVTPEPLPEAASPVSELETSAKTETTVTEIALPKATEAVGLVTKPELKATVDKLTEQTISGAAVKPEPAKSEPAKTELAKTELAKTELAKTALVTTGFVRVKLLLTGSSWIGVQDKNGKTVFSKLAKAGTEEFVEGLPPLKFHIGNASATQVIFNGETIDLTPSTYNNMARITVGDH
jgi:cytoskeleton protein RodZ